MKLIGVAGAIVTLSLLTLFSFLGLWKVDFSLPIFSYENDTLAILFLVKSIITQGWIYSNDAVGLPHFGEVFSFNDYPTHADSLHYLIIKFLGLFSQNPVLILNCFFIITFPLIALSAFFCLRTLGIGNLSALCAALLYAFTPYHFSRNVWHYALANYALIPLMMMVCIWVIEGRIKFRNREFLISCTITILAAIGGIYYAFYFLVLLGFSWILRGTKTENFSKEFFYAPILAVLLCSALVLVYMPSFLYWMAHGVNPEIANRNPSESIVSGFRILNLFLPIENHYLESFAKLRGIFIENGIDGGFERLSESLGVLALAAFLFLLFWIFVREESNLFSVQQKKLLSNLAALNLATVLFATVGGFAMISAFILPQIRCHARASIFIAFLSLAALAVIFDKAKTGVKKFLIVALTILALFDQIGKFDFNDEVTKKSIARFTNEKNFIEKIEASLPEKSAIFILPVIGFPEAMDGDYSSAAGYIHSQNLRWSYPVMFGRESFKWQKKVINLDFADFISELKKAGFAGIYLDQKRYGKGLAEIEKKLKKLPHFYSDDKNLVFFRL